MHLVSRRTRPSKSRARPVRFRAGESIHTEDSYKYDLAEFARRAADCGWRADILDRRPPRFAVLHLTATGES